MRLSLLSLLTVVSLAAPVPPVDCSDSLKKLIQEIRSETSPSDTDPVSRLRKTFPQISRETARQLEKDIESLLLVAPELRDTREFKKQWKLDDEEVATLLASHAPFFNPEVLGQRYLKQENAVSKFLDWVKANGRVPVQRDFGTGRGKLNLSQAALYGTPVHDDPAKQEAFVIFSSMEEALRAIKQVGKRQGVKVRLLDFKWPYGFTPAVRKEVQDEAAEAFVDWLKAHPGEIPEKGQFGSKPGQLGLNQSQLYGSDRWGLSGASRSSRIFDSMEEALLKIKAKAAEQNVPLRLLDFKWPDGFSTTLLPHVQSEAIDIVLQWMKAHPGEVPIAETYSDDAFPFRQEQFYGTGHYRADKEYYGSRLFDSPEKALFALKKAGEAAGVRVRLIDFGWKNGYPDAVRLEMQKEVVQMVIEWMDKNGGRRPVQDDFGAGPGKVGISQDQVHGNGEYRRGRPSYSVRIFDSGRRFSQALERELDQRATPR